GKPETENQSTNQEKEKVMDRKSTANLKVLTQVVEYGKHNVSLFPKESAAPETIETLDSIVRKLSELASARFSAEIAMRENLKARMTSREKLRDVLKRAEWISSAFGSEKVRPPANYTDDALSASAHAFIEGAGSLATDFAKHGVHPDDVGTFVEALE